MFIIRENALKPIIIHVYHIVLYKEITLKKTILIQNLNKIFTKTHQIAHFFKIFSQGSKPPSMCAADIILSI